MSKARKMQFIGGPLADAEIMLPINVPNRASIPLYRVSKSDEDEYELVRAPGNHLYWRGEDSKQFVYVMCTS